MNFGICNVSVAPVRAEASDKSEMVTQLIFGEKVEVLKEQKKWLHIKSDFDNYEGWVDCKQISSISEEDFFNLQPLHYTGELFNLLLNNEGPLTVPFGAHLPCFEDNKITIGNQTFEVLSDVIKTPETATRNSIVETAVQFVNVPYLWGGKSNFGIDCSGLVQQVYKINGIQLPRDAYQQAEMGEMLGFVAEAQPGDLAFFDNEEGRIIHVGIILENQRIIHAHGKVRIDPVDSTGIFNTDTQNYSHKLRFIKSILE